MIFKRLLLVIVCLAFTEPAFSQDLGKLYFQRDYWLKFNWDAAEESTLWKNSGFAPYSSTSADGMNFHHNQRITIDGRSYIAALAEYTRMIVRKDFTTLALQDKALGDCEKTNQKLKQVFPNQTGPIDNTYFVVTGFPLAEVVWQWEVGPTRVTLKCSSIGSDKNAASSISIYFEAATDENKQEPPIHLSCDRSYMLTDKQAKEWSTAQPLQITVIPAEKVVTNAELLKIGKVESISGSQIDFSQVNSELNFKYSISRIDGSLIGTATGKRDGLVAANFQGKCQRRSQNERKF